MPTVLITGANRGDHAPASGCILPRIFDADAAVGAGDEDGGHEESPYLCVQAG